jgi:hypothetical protein
MFDRCLPLCAYCSIGFFLDFVATFFALTIAALPDEKIPKDLS